MRRHLLYHLRSGSTSSAVNLSVTVATSATVEVCHRFDFGGTAANADDFRGGLPFCQHGGTPARRQVHGGGEMARKHGGNGGKPESKLGHRVAPAASSVVSLMAEIFQIPENQLIEGVIRLGFDHLPVSQRDAISVLLRAKGESIRDLRPLAKLTDQTETAAAVPAGETLPAGGAVSVRIDRIGEIARKSAAPVDAALDEIAG